MPTITCYNAAGVQTFDVECFIQNRKTSQGGAGLRKVTLDMPVEVGCLSRNADKSWTVDSREHFAAFSLPKLPVDLNSGFREFDQTYVDIGPESLELLLKSVKSLRDGDKYKPQIVTWRGALRKIMTTPYLQRETYRLGVWKKNNVVYIQTRQDPDKEEFHDMKERFKRFMYYGYKFEEVCTRQREEVEKQPDPNCCFNATFKSKLGNMRILYGGEVDCYDPENREYIELKVQRLLENDRHIYNFERFKLLKHYCQSFLALTTSVVVGFRDDHGMLRKIQKFQTLKIPGMIKGRKDKLWCAKTCLAFLEEVLAWLLENVPEQADDDDILEYHFNGSEITLKKSKPMSYEKISEYLYWP
uniref:Decapping nuclease n=1 Tax=Aplanochytrium stocchinoi TaxID=215587 RepID=A0A7S3PF68_9STRA